MTKSVYSLLACMLVTLVLGSVHAFSVFLLPLETSLQLPRSQISLIYSFALVMITLAVTIGYRIYDRLQAWWLVLVTGVFAATGLAIAALAEGWWALFGGYSLAFGFANGIGYGYCLQLSARVMPARRGMAMGAVTAAYALGSILFAKVFHWRISVDSLSSAFAWGGTAILLAVVIAAAILRLSGAKYGSDDSTSDLSASPLPRRRLLQFWFAYLTSVFAGLMAIGHAAAILQAQTGESGLAGMAAVIVGIGSAAGGFGAGWLVDRWSLNRFLIGLPLLSALALLALPVASSTGMTLGLLAVAGFAYGSIIAIYPVAIAGDFGERGAQAYGRVFLAWGMAGLAAPWLAGLIYDLRGDYGLALLIAALLALLSAVCAGVFRLGKAG